MTLPAFSRSLPRLSRLLALLVAGAALALTPGTLASANLPAQPPPARGEVFEFPAEIRFSQLNWLAADGRVLVPASKVGVAEFAFGANASQLLDAHGGGFVNVVTQTSSAFQWSVENLYLTFRNEAELFASRPTVQFDLGVENGSRTGELIYDVTITPTPLEAPLAEPYRAAPVELRDYLVGGRKGGGSELSTIPNDIGPAAGTPALAERTARILVPVNDLPKVDEEKNGCAPGAVARSIKYMMDRCRVRIPGVQDIYGGLKRRMKTDVTGTTDDNLLRGKREYTKEMKLPIHSEIIYLKEKAEKRNRRVVEVILKALEKGADVELLISWKGGGGHAVMVTQITRKEDGSYVITYVDDPVQGDGKAENREHVITVKPDGSFDGGKIDGFFVEIPLCAA